MDATHVQRGIPSVTLVGHPFTPIGMGEHLRCTFRALRSVARTPRIVDLYRLTAPDEGQGIELAPHVSRSLSDINVFAINGDEVEQALAHLGDEATRGYRVVYPLWELPRYPAEWARQLERFDEIWAPSRFVEGAIRAQTERTVHYMPLSGDVLLSSFVGRRYFGLAETPYTFLFSFDLRSYASRKNPQAVVEAFRALVRARPAANVALVIKVNGADRSPDLFEQLRDSMADLGGRVQLVDRSMSDNEMKNLMRCCDCFVSLHRSEGFGFGMAQAMYLGKPVIATGWSGNVDYMTSDASFVVPCTLVPVPEGAYPHWQDQTWAEPSVDDAAAAMVRLVDAPAHGHALGMVAARHIRGRFGLRNNGVRLADRIDRIAASDTRRPTHIPDVVLSGDG